MILKFLNTSLRKRVLLMFAIIGLMLIIDMVVISYYQNRIDQHSKALTIIYRSQSSIESISNAASKIFRQNEFDIKDELLLTSSQVSQDIDVLIKGGKIADTDLVISPMSEDIQREIITLRGNWRQAVAFLEVIQSDPIRVDSTIRDQVIKTEFIDSTYQKVSREIDRVILVPNPNIKKSLSQFSSYKKLLFSDLGHLTTSVITDYEQRRWQYGLALWMILLINLAVVGLFLFLMIKAIITPLGKIGHLTAKIVNGENVDIKYSKPDEIGKIVSSIKSLDNHLRQASDFVHHIGEGNLSVTLEGLSEEMGKEGSLANSLINMQNKLKLVSNQDEMRNWATKGMANFAEILRANNSSLKLLGDAVLAELIDYTDTSIGCIYVSDQSNDNKSLQLIAFYAYDTKKHFNESVTIGEGLIGQTFIEKKTTYLLEIPEDYPHIKSGVGASSPKSILVVPLQVNNEIYGVLEIASFKKLSSDQISFIEKIGETIAGAVRNVINAEQTKRLLEDSQQLTEQMGAQEKEMRQNMEELFATQEDVSRKELQTSSTIEAFDQAVATVEFDQDGIITNINSLFAKLSGQSKDMLIGSNIATLISTESNEQIQPIIDTVFQSKKSSTYGLKIIQKGLSDSLSITANISPLMTEHALMICHESATSTPSSANQVTEIEEELTQNLNMLEVTQKSLDEKLNTIKNSLVYLEIDISGQIVSSSSKSRSILTSKKADHIGKYYLDLLSLPTAIAKTVQDDIDQKHHYHGIVSSSLFGNKNQKIMLCIEQLKDKK